MFMCVGLHAYTVWLRAHACVCVKERVCVCTDSVDRSSWKETWVAENFLWSLTITNSWKWSVTKTGQWQRFFFFRSEGSLFEEVGLWVAKWRGLHRAVVVYVELDVPAWASSHFSFLSVKCAISFHTELLSSFNKLHLKWKWIYANSQKLRRRLGIYTPPFFLLKLSAVQLWMNVICT